MAGTRSPSSDAYSRERWLAHSANYGVALGACGIGCGAAALPLRCLSQFSNRWITTKNAGTNKTARQVEAIMPENTVMPIDLRALAPAPVASTSGTTPRMKANEVIRIGRKRARAASIADSMIG